MTTYTNTKDNGKNGKNFEVAVRMAITPKTTATYCKAMRLTDHRIKVNGKFANIEIKSGAGTLDYNATNTDIPATEQIDNLLPNTAYIIYTPEWDGEDALENAWVFTRTAFLNFLKGYAGMVKYTRKGNATAINIQTFTNSKKRLAYVWNATLDQPTLAEWLDTIR